MEAIMFYRLPRDVCDLLGDGQRLCRSWARGSRTMCGPHSFQHSCYYAHHAVGERVHAMPAINIESALPLRLKRHHFAPKSSCIQKRDNASPYIRTQTYSDSAAYRASVSLLLSASLSTDIATECTRDQYPSCI